jgi:hypothetical protein
VNCRRCFFQQWFVEIPSNLKSSPALQVLLASTGSILLQLASMLQHINYYSLSQYHAWKLESLDMKNSIRKLSPENDSADALFSLTAAKLNHWCDNSNDLPGRSLQYSMELIF